jgi:hypothetical protein
MSWPPEPQLPLASQPCPPGSCLKTTCVAALPVVAGPAAKASAAATGVTAIAAATAPPTTRGLIRFNFANMCREYPLPHTCKTSPSKLAGSRFGGSIWRFAQASGLEGIAKISGVAGGAVRDLEDVAKWIADHGPPVAVGGVEPAQPSAADRHGRRWCGRRVEETLTSGPYAAAVGMVDPDDDSICRWVVSHFRYDPARNERRNVVVAAFDNPDEFDADIKNRAARLRVGKECGDVDTAENITGQIREPGYRHMRQNARLLRRAVQHGVFPARIEDLQLPPNVAVAQARTSVPVASGADSAGRADR